MANKSNRTATLGIAILMTAVPGGAQDFGGLQSALVDYSKAGLEARKACEEMGRFKSKDIVQIAAVAIDASLAPV